MNRLNQAEPATFSILSFWAFFRDSYFLYFNVKYAVQQRQRLLTDVGFSFCGQQFLL
jgi:hypothetical protein